MAVFSWARWWLLAVLGFSAACAEPSYELAATDGGTTTGRLDAADEGTTMLSPPLEAGPSSADAIVDGVDRAAPEARVEEFPLGQYALVARLNGRAIAAVGGWFGEELVALLDVHRTPERLEVRWKTCHYGGRLGLGGVLPDIVYKAVQPDRLPERTFELRVNGHDFEMLGPAVPAGYEELADCPAGDSQVRANRPWLPDGRCTCASDPAPPTSARDCRVIDSDGDGAPGFTVKATGTINNDEHMRMLDKGQFVNGQVAADGRHTAQFAADFDGYQLECARDPCIAGGQVCPLAKNPARFLKLEASAIGWSCSDVMGAVQNSDYIGLGPIGKPDC